MSSVITPPGGIAARLREHTRAEHEHAETRSFMSDLLAGRLSLQAYATYLAQYAWVYAALESRARQEGDPEFVHDRALHRLAAIDADLAALGLDGWRTDAPPLGATAAYVARLEGAAGGAWPTFVAHHYVRYLGDLSGGQVIATMMRRHYGARDDQLGFYSFAGIGNLVAYKRDYRANLDALALTESEADELVGEARAAFVLNSAVFDALTQTYAPPESGQG